MQRKESDYGKKIVIYGPSGAGKTSLATLAPEPIFIDLNNGTSGLTVNLIPGVTNFDELRDAVRQSVKLVPEGGTLVIDTISEVDALLTNHLKTTLKLESIKKLGYDRFPSSVEAFRTLLTGFDPVLRAGRTVVLTAHSATINFKNALGVDYRQEGPKLTHSANDSCRDEMTAWADHVFHIGFEEVEVGSITESGPNKVKVGKVSNASTDRVILSVGTASMIAKSRPVGGRHLPARISFAGPTDASLWSMLFNPDTIPQE